MPKMFDKKSILNFFHYYGMLILIATIVTFATWYWVIYVVTSPEAHEKISFFIEAEGLVDQQFERDLEDDLEDEGLVEARVYPVSIYNTDMANQYERFGRESDFLILRSIDLVDMAATIALNFLEISDNLWQEIVINPSIKLDYYQYQEINYGLKIYDQNDESYNQYFAFEKFCQFALEEDVATDYYLLFNRESVNFGAHNAHSKSELAISAAQFFFTRYQK